MLAYILSRQGQDQRVMKGVTSPASILTSLCLRIPGWQPEILEATLGLFEHDLPISSRQSLWLHIPVSLTTEDWLYEQQLKSCPLVWHHSTRYGRETFRPQE
jgi:hypothetical protein